MKLYDINLHLDQFSSPLSILNEYAYFNINRIIALCDNLKSFEFLKQLLPDKKEILIGIGLHPNRKYLLPEIREILKIIKTEIRIVGECGLDFSKKINSPKIQYRNLIAQLKLAEALNLIVILHIINAENEILEILNSFNLKHVILHWFSGNKIYLNKMIQEDFYFSFNHCILHSKKYQDYISQIPLNKILLESDAPYIYKGRVTKPEDFRKIVNVIAEIKSLEIGYVSNILYDNFKRVILNNYDFDRKKTRKKFGNIDDFI